MGRDETKESPPGIPANADSREIAQAEETTQPDEEWNELHEDWEGEADPGPARAWTMPTQ